MLEDDLLRSDPWHTSPKTDTKIDVACLLTPEKAIFFITNTDYTIQDSAYQWNIFKKVKLRVLLPSWFKASDGFELHPVEGIRPVLWSDKHPYIDLELETLSMGSVIVVTKDKNSKALYEGKFRSLLAVEGEK
jgi:hypothetical protein